MIVHVGSTNTKTAVDLAKHAESVGSSHISSVPPYYYKHNKYEIIVYFESLLKAVNIPVYVYNNPKTVGYAVSPELLNELANIGIRGVKYSSFDIMVLNDYIRKVKKENFDVVLGTEAMFLPSSVLGVKAFIPGIGNAFPELLVELYNACMNGEYSEARKIQTKVLFLRDTMHITGASIPAVYEMLKFRNVNAGLPRKPCLPLSKEMSNKIYKRLKETGVI
ncbi:putative 2-dehydro-3-deoxy-D-pentonate aldolase YjhH [subsurface metagenome]